MMIAAGIDDEDNESFCLLETIFGEDPLITYDVFIQKMTGPAKWAFDSGNIRDVTFNYGIDQ